MIRRWRSVMSDEVLRLEGIGKTFNQGTALEARVLQDINLRLGRGELTALIGPSGSGKCPSRSLTCLPDVPTAGELFPQGRATRSSGDVARTRRRNESLGFVFQFRHLISAFSVLENVLMPLIIRSGRPSAEAV